MTERRTDHAGESGAVMMYPGMLSVTSDRGLRAFVSDHLATESRNFACIEQVAPTIIAATDQGDERRFAQFHILSVLQTLADIVASATVLIRLAK